MRIIGYLLHALLLGVDLLFGNGKVVAPYERWLKHTASAGKAEQSPHQLERVGPHTLHMFTAESSCTLLHALRSSWRKGRNDTVDNKIRALKAERRHSIHSSLAIESVIPKSALLSLWHNCVFNWTTSFESLAELKTSPMS